MRPFVAIDSCRSVTSWTLVSKIRAYEWWSSLEFSRDASEHYSNNLTGFPRGSRGEVILQLEGPENAS